MTKLPLSRDQAWELIKRHNTHDPDLIHYLESEAVMKELALHLGEDSEYWAMLGLLHDVDWGITKQEVSTHLSKMPEILRKEGFTESFIETILSHGYGFEELPELASKRRTEKIQHALAASETITGLVHAYALMRGSKISDMEPSGLKKKFKDKTFAAKVSREVIKEIENCGISLDEFFKIAIEGIKKIKGEVGLV